MKPNEFINIIHNQNIDFIKTDNIDGLNGIQQDEINFKKRKLTNIESEIPKILNLLNNEIKRINNINE